MLELIGLYKTFNPGTVNEKRAINGLNLTLEDGDFVTIIGGNGAGRRKRTSPCGICWKSSTWKTTGCCSPNKGCYRHAAENSAACCFSALRKGTLKHCLWTGDKWRVLGAWVSR